MPASSRPRARKQQLNRGQRSRRQEDEVRGGRSGRGEVRGEARGGGRSAGPGLIARSVDRRSLERGGATHGRVTAWAITHKEVRRGAVSVGGGIRKEKPARHGYGASEREARACHAAVIDREAQGVEQPGRTSRRRCVAGRSKAGQGVEACGAWVEGEHQERERRAWVWVGGTWGAHGRVGWGDLD